MALARVVTFDGVGSERVEEMKREMQDGDRPRGFRRRRSSCSTTARPSRRW